MVLMGFSAFGIFRIQYSGDCIAGVALVRIIGPLGSGGRFSSAYAMEKVKRKALKNKMVFFMENSV